MHAQTHQCALGYARALAHASFMSSSPPARAPCTCHLSRSSGLSSDLRQAARVDSQMAAVLEDETDCFSWSLVCMSQFL